MLARAHVPDLARFLAVARKTSGGKGVQRCPQRAAAEHLLRYARPPKDGLQGPHVDVLARMGAGHDRQIGGREVEGLDAAGFHERDQPERLHGGPEIDDEVRVAQHSLDRAVHVRLDDRATVAALDHVTTNLAHQDRGGSGRLGAPHRGPSRAGISGPGSNRRSPDGAVAACTPSRAARPRGQGAVPLRAGTRRRHPISSGQRSEDTPVSSDGERAAMARPRNMRSTAGPPRCRSWARADRPRPAPGPPGPRPSSRPALVAIPTGRLPRR